jgi:hypothetical protein
VISVRSDDTPIVLLGIYKDVSSVSTYIAYALTAWFSRASPLSRPTLFRTGAFQFRPACPFSHFLIIVIYLTSLGFYTP